jgi:arylsulfatase A-like enzyme
MSENKPSPRDEVVYDIEPFRAALRKGDWKLVWKATLPSRVELFNLKQDPYEKTNLADKYPQKVEELQQEIEAMEMEAVQPLFLVEAFGVAKDILFGSVATPEDEKALEDQP